MMLWVCASAHSQTFNKVYRSVLSYYQNGSWVQQTSEYPQNMYVIINGDDIRINNVDQSHYITFGNPQKDAYESHTCYTWDCMDKKGESCLFMMKQFKNSQFVFTFVYMQDKTMFEYVIEKNEK
jgi:hypothetical protein